MLNIEEAMGTQAQSLSSKAYSPVRETESSRQVGCGVGAGEDVSVQGFEGQRKGGWREQGKSSQEESKPK